MKCLPLTRAVVILSCISILLYPTALIARDAEDRPNIVIIYGDDVGFADVAAYGDGKIPTPNIDKLISEGLMFTDGHSSASTCSPSRFSMLTGVHAFRHNIRILPPEAALSIPTDALTLPKVFKRKGYTTGIIGKWHLGLGNKGQPLDLNHEVKPGPQEIGFDSVFLLPSTNDRVPCVYIEGNRVVNLDPKDPIHLGQKRSDVQVPGSTQYPDAKANKPSALYSSIIHGIGRIGYMSGGRSALWDDEKMSDLFIEKAKAFLTQNKENPFFLFFSSQDIHVPNAPHARFKGATTLGKRGDAMVQFDWSVGEIMKSLETHGLRENTIILFTSDNGPTLHNDGYRDGRKELKTKVHPTKRHDASGIWRGGKYEIFEGGTRVPFVISWPGKISPGISDSLVNQIDFIASFSSLLGLELKKGEAIDSRNNLDVFMGKNSKGLAYLIEESGDIALRKDQWKFVPARDPKRVRFDEPVVDTLYDLESDPMETNNVIGNYPDLADQLKKTLDDALKKDGSVSGR